MSKHGLEGVSVVWWFMLILSNLHNLPCICIKMAPTGTFFTFLLVAGNKGEKKKLSTCQNMFWKFWKAFLLFGDLRYSSQFAVYMHHCLVAGNTVEKGKLRTWHNMIWKAFLLFGNYTNLHLLPCIFIKMAPTGTFFTLLLVAGNKVETRKLRTCQRMVWKGFCCLVIYANLHHLPCICIKMAPTGTFFSLSCDCWY